MHAPHSSPSFISDLGSLLVDEAGHDYDDNYDWRRFGPLPEREAVPAPRRRSWLGRLSRSALRKRPAEGRQLSSSADVKFSVYWGLRFADPHARQLQWLYERLGDQESRDLLLRLFAYRALGHRRIKLPLNHPDFWRQVESLERQAEASETVDAGFLGWKLPKLDMRPYGYPIELFFRPDGAAIHFLQQQYRCATADGAIEAKEGDVVVDAGGCWGDSALYFAHKAGRQGKVYSFEFLPENLQLYRRNLQLNPELASRIELLPHPVWSEGDVELFVTQNGPGTTVGSTRQSDADQTVRTIAIDQLMTRPGFTRIDFIKMDIEGAGALKQSYASIARAWP
jgi:FkbM family methyltransferase